MTTPEGYVKRQLVIPILYKVGAYQFWPVQTGMGKRTIDCLACLNGRFVGIETKRPGVHKGTSMQEAIMDQIREAGGVAGIVQNEQDLETLLADVLRPHT